MVQLVFLPQWMDSAQVKLFIQTPAAVRAWPHTRGILSSQHFWLNRHLSGPELGRCWRCIMFLWRGWDILYMSAKYVTESDLDINLTGSPPTYPLNLHLPCNWTVVGRNETGITSKVTTSGNKS